MNKQNALRHYLSKIKKGHIDLEMITEIQSYISDKYCIGCPFDDFGYCSFRNSTRSMDDIAKNHCAPSIINYIEKSLENSK